MNPNFPRNFLQLLQNDQRILKQKMKSDGRWHNEFERLKSKEAVNFFSTSEGESNIVANRTHEMACGSVSLVKFFILNILADFRGMFSVLKFGFLSQHMHCYG